MTFTDLPIGTSFRWIFDPIVHGAVLDGTLIKTGPFSFRRVEDKPDWIWDLRPDEFHVSARVAAWEEPK